MECGLASRRAASFDRGYDDEPVRLVQFIQNMPVADPSAHGVEAAQKFHVTMKRVLARFRECRVDTVALGELNTLQSFDHPRRTVSMLEFDENQSTSSRLDNIASDNLFAAIVAAFNEHNWTHQLDQFKRRIFLKDDDEIYCGKSCKHPGPRLLRHYRAAARAFVQSRDRCIAVKTEHQSIAGRPSLFENFNVARMDEIETSICKSNPESKVAPFLNVLPEGRLRYDFMMGAVKCGQRCAHQNYLDFVRRQGRDP
jgi:hypothetical protein